MVGEIYLRPHDQPPPLSDHFHLLGVMVASRSPGTPKHIQWVMLGSHPLFKEATDMFWFTEEGPEMTDCSWLTKLCLSPSKPC
jgi:hypothetical protein